MNNNFNGRYPADEDLAWKVSGAKTLVSSSLTPSATNQVWILELKVYIDHMATIGGLMKKLK